MSIRDYWEQGCLCILTGRTKLQHNETDEVANAYYLLMCQCSRHPESYLYADPDLERKMRKELGLK